MKSINYNKYNSFLFIAFWALMGFGSCKKVDDTYKNYKNTIGDFKGNALSYLQSQQGLYDSMLLVINRLNGLSDTLATGNVTVFAIPNGSFDLAVKNVNQARRDSIPAMPPVSLSTMDSATLDEFFCRYILIEKVSTDSIINFSDGRYFPSIKYDYPMQLQFTQTNASGFLGGGPKAIIFSDPQGSMFMANWVRTTTITVNIKTTNAIVHLLPSSHNFGFGASFIRLINRQ